MFGSVANRILVPPLPLDKPIGEMMLTRSSARTVARCDLTLEQTASIFGYAYGITRDQRSMGFPRRFRACPSAGGLYPLELYFNTEHVIGLPAGPYHFNPEKRRLEQLCSGGRKDVWAKAVVQPNAVGDSALVYFITPVFDRTIFKYGDRGYRFVHIETITSPKI